MDTFQELVAVACRGDLRLEMLNRYCVDRQTDIPSACNTLALHIAQEFLTGALGFDESDQAVNSLFAVMTSKRYFECLGQVFPEAAFKVYQAFAAGEGIHLGDKGGEMPYAKYTIPMLREILRS